MKILKGSMCEECDEYSVTSDRWWRVLALQRLVRSFKKNPLHALVYKSPSDLAHLWWKLSFKYNTLLRNWYNVEQFWCNQTISNQISHYSAKVNRSFWELIRNITEFYLTEVTCYISLSVGVAQTKNCYDLPSDK